MLPLANGLVTTLNNEQQLDRSKKRLNKAFNVLKGGFYSKDREVVALCGILFTRLAAELS